MLKGVSHFSDHSVIHLIKIVLYDLTVRHGQGLAAHFGVVGKIWNGGYGSRSTSMM